MRGGSPLTACAALFGVAGGLEMCLEREVCVEWERVMSDLMNAFGPIDIYLFDQLLRGRILPGMRVLDVGCGGGRNLVYLLREGFEVYGVDEDPRAVAAVRELATQLGGVAEQFRVEAMEAMSFEEGFAEVVIASAVLH